MKYFKLDNWAPDFRHDGLLYFTHRIQEMLSYYSEHIYKVPVMNTHLLIHEYLHTAKLVKEKIINGNHLKYIMEEFQDTFINDLIVRENIVRKRREGILQKLNSATIEEQEKIMRYLLHVFQSYNLWCKDYLKKIVPQEREKRKIDRALKCFIPGLIGAGYSHEFIFFYNRLIFEESPVASLETLNIFLDRFDFKKKSYDIYLAVDKRFVKFKEILEKHLRIIFDYEADTSDLKCDRNLYTIIKVKSEAFDERAASENAYNQISLFFRYYNFWGDKKGEWLANPAKVIDENGHCSFVDLYPEGFDYPNLVGNTMAGEISAGTISALLVNARHSFDTIDRAVNMHNVAIANKDIRNGFLNLWSVFEILFVSDQTESKSTEIEKKAVPILHMDYLHYMIGKLKKDFNDNLSKGVKSELEKKLGASDTWDQILNLLFSPECSQVRTELYSILSDFPLIRSRLIQISKDYLDRKNILSDIEKFKRRISWHFKRLYRTRNAIIHAGETPDNLKELGEHLHEYVDECLNEIIFRLVTKTQLHTIDDVIIDMQLREREMMDSLRCKEALDKKTISALFK